VIRRACGVKLFMGDPPKVMTRSGTSMAVGSAVS
jgi:hypothetical protein